MFFCHHKHIIVWLLSSHVPVRYYIMCDDIVCACITDYVCSSFIYDLNGDLIPAHIQSVKTSTNVETLIMIPCSATEVKWLLIQQRVDDSVSFTQNITTYQNGFGDPDGNYFMGLNKISEMTSDLTDLQVYLESFDGDTAIVLYGLFKLGNVFNPLEAVMCVSNSTVTCL